MKLSKALLSGCLICFCILVACGNESDNKKPDVNSPDSSKIDKRNSQPADSPAVIVDVQDGRLEGTIGESPWGSGWLDLNSVKSFRKGDTLNIRIGGTAKKVLVRLLPINSNANLPNGIEGGVRDVPATKMITVVLAADRNDITQISVHGKDAFGNISGENGHATMISVIYKSHK
jgi:hypothetical protein